MRGVCILVLLHKDNKLRSIYRKLKRQDDLCGYECPQLFLFLAFLQQLRKGCGAKSIRSIIRKVMEGQQETAKKCRLIVPLNGKKCPK